jgi:UDP-N-acetylglucosamine--N-acetylmuramyl-(pentapeptide) pyrophosphoryl-undecaprenol N-acetylglucosamine transferase
VRIVIAGGGTAGHVSPSIAVADRLRDDGVDVEFVGSPSGQEASLVPAAGYRFHPVAARPFPREVSVRSLTAPIVALRSVAACRPIVRGAGAVVGMGGYASIPAVLAARSISVPALIHEQNAVPGLANRMLARVAVAAAVSFETTRASLPTDLRVVVTGTPVRRRILAVPERRDELRVEAVATLGLDPDRTTVLVTGGSLGALHLDRTVAGAIPLLSGRRDLQLLVLTGPEHESVVAGPAARPMELLVRTLPYLDRMDLALSVADLAVSRAGSNTIHELALCGVPSILVPYPHATGRHQEVNARELEGRGAAEVYLDRDLTPEGLARRVVSLAGDERRRASMGEKATAWAKPDADRRVAALASEVARG